MKNADGLWQADQLVVNSVWSQVTDFPKTRLAKTELACCHQSEVEIILLCEAGALFRGLQVMVCAEHVRNARVRLTDSMSCALAFERRRARIFF